MSNDFLLVQREKHHLLAYKYKIFIGKCSLNTKNYWNFEEIKFYLGIILINLPSTTGLFSVPNTISGAEKYTVTESSFNLAFIK